MEPDGQDHMETVALNDESSYQFQNPCNAEETRSETEIYVDAFDC